MSTTSIRRHGGRSPRRDAKRSTWRAWWAREAGTRERNARHARQRAKERTRAPRKRKGAWEEGTGTPSGTTNQHHDMHACKRVVCEGSMAGTKPCDDEETIPNVAQKVHDKRIHEHRRRRGAGNKRARTYHVAKAADGKRRNENVPIETTN